MVVQGAVETTEDPAREPAPKGPTRVERAPRRRGRSAHLSVVVVLIAGALITTSLSLGAQKLRNSNENRLLRQRVREVALVFSAAIPSLQTPLSSAAVLAESTNGNVAAFRDFMKPIVASGRTFTSVSLWPKRGAVLRPLATVGKRPELAGKSQSTIRAFIRRAASANTVTVNNLLAGPDRRLGYAFALASAKSRYVVYAETELPKNRRAAIDKNSAFADLGYALYIGRKPDPRFLLASSTGGALLHGRRAYETVAFGDSQLLVIMTPHKDLGGNLLARLWWILGGAGFVLTLGAGSLVGRLSRRRKDAEGLARENARLYAQQRSVAETLQHSLLAEAFPEVGGLEIAARYVAGVEGIEIGGDWYDVVRLDGGNILMVVGDVSGRGLEAATMMAALRFAARAYAAEGHSPALILSKLSSLVSIGRDGHFATVLCGLLDVAGRRVTIANAGHPEPLLISDSGAEFVATDIGTPVGVARGTPYTEVETAFPRGSTLLLYTDGAIERRGECIDVGLQRLKDMSLGVHGSLEDLLARVVDGVMADGVEDDTALLGLRWRE